MLLTTLVVRDLAGQLVTDSGQAVRVTTWVV